MSLQNEIDQTIQALNNLGVALKNNEMLDEEAREFCIRLLRFNIEQAGGFYAAAGVPSSVPRGGSQSSNSNTKCPHCNNDIYVKKTP
ncbi:hypothetical protein [Halomonas heilongjiangensis]|uniref:hypothetical protein n=1 Tax=Halomonas heilongjiangensis TaxID=1387883 RepID=UPI0011AF211D|nr:hypothetical protein [Halomonas heilongjiangensis]